ncbi:hypothetical protein [Pseudomonas nitroreducens]|uniref:hypothetical protein n=1 Tax=Pseudomonas nitroreducens TaxID=46680 RepID=UPI00265A4332|nr:hypothetical protein [Pseudomonas nitroreducens]MCP1652698.1 hypothetical protein [Pseudomonas nitroreducens]
MDEQTSLPAVLAKGTPPAAYGVAFLSGMTIEQWISVLTVVYLLLAILSLLFPEWRKSLWGWVVRKWRS